MTASSTTLAAKATPGVVDDEKVEQDSTEGEVADGLEEDGEQMPMMETRHDEL